MAAANNASSTPDEAASRQRLSTLCEACGHVLRMSNAFRLATSEADRALKRDQVRVLHRHARKVFEHLIGSGEERLLKAHRTDGMTYMQKADAAFTSVFPGEALSPLVEVPAKAEAAPQAAE